jgi:hypothetical protein
MEISGHFSTEIDTSAQSLGWSVAVEDATEAECDLQGVAEDLEPYWMRIGKPLPGTGLRRLTRAGFDVWLEDASSVGKVEVAGLGTHFSTYGFVVVP